MKKVLFICAVVALASCGGTKTEEQSTMTAADSIAVSDSAFGAWADSVACSTATCDTAASCTTK